MTGEIALQGRKVIGFDMPFPCRCGRERRVLVRNLRTDMAIDDRWRDAGDCPQCGDGATYRLRLFAETCYVDAKVSDAQQ